MQVPEAPGSLTPSQQHAKIVSNIRDDSRPDVNHEEGFKLTDQASSRLLCNASLSGQIDANADCCISSPILADACLFLGNDLGTSDFRREPQKTAGTGKKPQIGVCPLRLVFCWGAYLVKLGSWEKNRMSGPKPSWRVGMNFVKWSNLSLS